MRVLIEDILQDFTRIKSSFYIRSEDNEAVQEMIPSISYYK